MSQSQWQITLGPKHGYGEYIEAGASIWQDKKSSRDFLFKTFLLYHVQIISYIKSFLIRGKRRICEAWCGSANLSKALASEQLLSPLEASVFLLEKKKTIKQGICHLYSLLNLSSLKPIFSILDQKSTISALHFHAHLKVCM